MPSPDSTADRPPVVVPAPDPARDARVAARRAEDARKAGVALVDLMRQKQWIGAASYKEGWYDGYAASELHHNGHYGASACPTCGAATQENVACADCANAHRERQPTQQPPPCPDHRGLGDVNQLSCAWCGEERAAFYRRLADSR